MSGTMYRVHAAFEAIEDLKDVTVIAGKDYYCSNDIKQADEKGYNPIAPEISDGYDSKEYCNNNIFT
ncbi:MAG: hypothetical protein MK132_00055 [Lentisphaerales bacterium]|nr:hypothetical protein [Lentisphaerales bacterium]